MRLITPPLKMHSWFTTPYINGDKLQPHQLITIQVYQVSLKTRLMLIY